MDKPSDARVMDVHDIPIDSVRPVEWNYNTHDEEQIAELEASDDDFGQFRNIVTWNGFIICGTGYWLARKKKGSAKIAAEDRSDLTETQAKALAAADNETARKSRSDYIRLAAIVNEVATSGKRVPGISDLDVARMIQGTQKAWPAAGRRDGGSSGAGGFGSGMTPQLASAYPVAQSIVNDADEENERRAQEAHDHRENAPEVERADKAAELQKVWQVQTGDLWELGEHRLACCDCHKIELPKNAYLFTDPPYGIKIDTGWLSALHVQRGKPANLSDDLLEGDDGALDLDFLWQYERRFVWGFPYIFDVEATGWIVWDKQPGIDGRGLVTPIEMAATTLRKGFDIVRLMWGGVLSRCGRD